MIWCGNGRRPASNHDCLHAVFYVLVSGIAWRMLPQGFPSYRTVQRRLKIWLEQEAFRSGWQQVAHRYEALQGINGDQLLLDGSKKPSKKGANKPDPVRLTGANVAQRYT